MISNNQFTIIKSENSSIPTDTPAGTSEGRLYLTFEGPSDSLFKYLEKRYPEYDWRNADNLKAIMYLATTANKDYFCKVLDSSNGGQTSQGWIDWFETNGIAYNLPDVLFNPPK